MTRTRPTSTRARGRDFHLLWLGESISLLGSATAAVLLPLLAVHLGAGAGWMGLLTAATWLPWLVIGLPAGAWVDRLSPRRVMVWADAASAVSLGSIPVAWWLGGLTLPHLLAAALASGTAAVFFRTAYAKLVPTVVPEEQLDSANARLFGTESAMMVVGPGVAGRLAATAGHALGLVLGVIGFCASALCLLRIRPARPVSSVRSDSRARSARSGSPTQAAVAAEPLVAQMRAGVRQVVRDPYLRWTTVIGALSNFGLTGYGALLVLYLVGIGVDERDVGTYFMVGAAGGVVGSLVAPRLARWLGTGRASVVLLLGSPAALLVGLPTSMSQLWVSLVGSAAVGAMVVGGNVIRSTWRQRYIPADLLGRVLAATATVNYGTMPLAGLVAGWFGTTLGVRPTVLLMAGVHVVASWLVLASPLARCRDLPLPEATTSDDARG